MTSREFTFSVSGTVPAAIARAEAFWKDKRQYRIERRTTDALEIKRKMDSLLSFVFQMVFAPTREERVTVRVITDAVAAQLGDLGWALDQWCKGEGIPLQHINKIGARDIMKRLGIFCACFGMAIGILILIGILKRL
jgi:hypothetical protein